MSGVDAEESENDTVSETSIEISKTLLFAGNIAEVEVISVVTEVTDRCSFCIDYFNRRNLN